MQIWPDGPGTEGARVRKADTRPEPQGGDSAGPGKGFAQERDWGRDNMRGLLVASALTLGVFWLPLGSFLLWAFVR